MFSDLFHSYPSQTFHADHLEFIQNNYTFGGQVVNNYSRLSALLFIFLNTYIIADAQGVEIPPCYSKIVTASSTGNDKLTAQRIAFIMGASDLLRGSRLEGMSEGGAAIQKVNELVSTSLGQNLEKSKGRMIPGFGPLKKPEHKSMNAGVTTCMYVRDKPFELFCHGLLWDDADNDKRKNNYFGASLKRVNSGWICEASVISMADVEKVIPVSESQKKEVEQFKFAKLAGISASNPYRIWGERNRCLWDETFAMFTKKCGTDQGAAQVAQAGTHELKVTGRGPADGKIIAAECGYLLDNGGRSDVKSVVEIAFAEAVKAGEMSRPFDVPKSTLIYPTDLPPTFRFPTVT